jgi:hypothetical protein
MVAKKIDTQVDEFKERMWKLKVRHEGWGEKEAEQNRFMKRLTDPVPTTSKLLDAINEIRSKQ